jgi:hypothetical protein
MEQSEIKSNGLLKNLNFATDVMNNDGNEKLEDFLFEMPFHTACM